MSTPRLQRIARARALRAFDHADTLTILGDDGAVRRFTGDSAELVRAILGFVVAPRTRDELAAHLSDLAGAPVTLTGTVEETLAHLQTAGAIREAPPRPLPKPPAGAPRSVRVVLGITGAVASSLMPSLVMVLQARGFTVQVAATRNALRFVTPRAIEALTHTPVYTGLWSNASPVPHIDLARWADVMVVCPATATTIARLASGSCGTLVSAVAIATRAPVLVVPSMNDAMYLAPAVQRNLAQLRDDGFYIAHPSFGPEVADAPPDRVPMLGPAPPIDAIADLVGAVVQQHGAARAEPPATPSWNDYYRAPPEHLPWFTETLDPDIAALLGAPAPGASQLLDLGTGHGTAAIAAADRGWSVVATDISSRALDLARKRAGARPVVWIDDDIIATRLRSTFDVVLDRGLLHVLPAGDQPLYAASVRDLLRPGGRLLLKVHSASEPHDHGTRRFTREDIAALFGEAFDLAHVEDTTFPGPGGRAPRALLCMLIRR